METKLLKGKPVSNHIKSSLSKLISNLKEDGIVPGLAAVLVGDDPASHVYVRSKSKVFESNDCFSETYKMSKDSSEVEILDLIDKLNNDSRIHGILVQLPLPNHLDSKKILNKVKPSKDVDGFHPTNFGRMALEMDSYIPATPFGIMEMLKRSEIDIKGKHCVVIGRSNIVGRPISILMSQKGNPGNATVTLAHSRTKNIEQLTQKADIIVSALGIPEFLKGYMVKEGVIVIDVGITRVQDDSHPKGYVIKGDVAFDEVAKKSSYITPVPGGVGPMTIAMLLKNTLLSCERKS